VWACVNGFTQDVTLRLKASQTFPFGDVERLYLIHGLHGLCREVATEGREVAAPRPEFVIRPMRPWRSQSRFEESLERRGNLSRAS